MVWVCCDDIPDGVKTIAYQFGMSSVRQRLTEGRPRVTMIGGEVQGSR